MKLRALAQGRDCQARLTGICNGNPETTVLAHLRLVGISGFGHKAPDFIAAWLCSACHVWVDTHKDLCTKVDFYEAIFRTQAKLIEEKEVTF